MTPLPFWQLLTGLVGLLVLGRIVAWWLWSALAFSGPRLGRSLTGLTRRPRLFERLARRWPRVAGFLKKRVAVEHFSGLPLTLFAALALYLVFLGAGLVEDLFEGEKLVAFDHQVNAGLAIVREPHFVQVVNWVTGLAAPSTLVAIVLVSIGFLWSDNRLRYVPGLVLTVVGSQMLTYIGKYAVGRDRPDFLTMASASTPSFPSAHATGAIAVYGFIIYAVAREMPGVKRRFELAYWGSALIVLIAASRAILSVHFASDIAAGLLVGGFWLLSGFALTEYLGERARR